MKTCPSLAAQKAGPLYMVSPVGLFDVKFTGLMTFADKYNFILTCTNSSRKIVTRGF
jgi:hypothetical protein